MAGIVPHTQQGAIDFFANRQVAWATNATAIGLSAAQVTAIATAINDAQSKLAAAQAARVASKTATLDLAGSMSVLRDLGGDLIKTIRAFAETSGNDNVYILSDIPPIAPPTPAGPPEQPTALAASILLPFGLGLTWKGSVAQGTYFGVWRKVGSETGFTLIDTTKAREYADYTLPANTSSVAYYIAANRDEYTVNSASLQIQIGASGLTSLSLAA